LIVGLGGEADDGFNPPVGESSGMAII
jgi:hypothetical protein